MTKISCENSCQNIPENKDDNLIGQEIKQRMENGPCTFLIEREIVRKYNISSWELNDGDGANCHEYDLNVGHYAPLPQYIYVNSCGCGSIFDNTSHTLINTIHLKVKNGGLRIISVPVSCKYKSLPKTEKGWCSDS